MKVFVCVNRNKAHKDRIIIYKTFEQAFNWLYYIVESNEPDRTMYDFYLRNLNYKDKVFILEKEIIDAA